MIDPTLFRGKPYTRPISFTVTFSGAVNEQKAIWLPKAAYFEVAEIVAFSTVAAELQIADTQPANIIGFIAFNGTAFSIWQRSLAGVRSNNPSNSQLLLVDAVGAAQTVHGTVYGWEVTPTGEYRTGS
jgi:hypothetical protein